METRPSGKAAPSGAMSPPQQPTDAHSEEEDPFASDGEQETYGATAEGTGETESADFRENPGKQLCEHVISSGETAAEESIEIMEQDGGENAVMQGCEPDPGGNADRHSNEMTVDDDDAPPAAASTPQRSQFRIVDIERRAAPIVTGDANSAKSPALPQTINSDVNSAAVVNSGSAPIPPMSDDHRAGGDGRTGDVTGPTMNAVTGDAGKAGSSREKTSDVSGAKVPSMVPPPKIPLKAPPKKVSSNTEKDAIPSDIYKSILAAKLARVTPAAIPGTGRSTADTSCGSFYNAGDNQIRRAVYKENVAKLSVTSISFNPVTWECASCPNRHPVLGKDEAGGDGRPVIFLTDQNFLAVLPTAGKCLAIIRLEHGTLKELTDLLLSIAPENIPAGTIFVLGSLTHLQCEGLQGYSSAGVRYGTKISGIFRDTTVVLFIPPPMGGCANPQLVRSIMDGCSWLCNIPSYPLKKSMQTVMNIVNEGAGGGTAPLSNRDDQ
jgi:hypothetical protein